jgi:hypothetical protein
MCHVTLLRSAHATRMRCERAQNKIHNSDRKAVLCLQLFTNVRIARVMVTDRMDNRGLNANEWQTIHCYAIMHVVSFF